MDEFIKVDFTITNGEYTLTDSLLLPADNTYTDEEIEAMKQARFDNFVTHINDASTIEG